MDSRQPTVQIPRPPMKRSSPPSIGSRDESNHRLGPSADLDHIEHQGSSLRMHLRNPLKRFAGFTL